MLNAQIHTIKDGRQQINKYEEPAIIVQISDTIPYIEKTWKSYLKSISKYGVIRKKNYLEVTHAVLPTYKGRDYHLHVKFQNPPEFKFIYISAHIANDVFVDKNLHPVEYEALYNLVERIMYSIEILTLDEQYLKMKKTKEKMNKSESRLLSESKKTQKNLDKAKKKNDKLNKELLANQREIANLEVELQILKLELNPELKSEADSLGILPSYNKSKIDELNQKLEQNRIRRAEITPVGE
jgi:hypothetical protein